MRPKMSLRPATHMGIAQFIEGRRHLGYHLNDTASTQGFLPRLEYQTCFLRRGLEAISQFVGARRAQHESRRSRGIGLAAGDGLVLLC